jgi:hypothetical protein
VLHSLYDHGIRASKHSGKTGNPHLGDGQLHRSANPATLRSPTKAATAVALGQISKLDGHSLWNCRSFAFCSLLVGFIGTFYELRLAVLL